MQVKKQQLEPDMEQPTGSNWEGIHQGCIFSPCLFNFIFIQWRLRLDETQARTKVAKRNINNLRYSDATTLLEESEEELTSLLMNMKEEKS